MHIFYVLVYYIEHLDVRNDVTPPSLYYYLILFVTNNTHIFLHYVLVTRTPGRLEFIYDFFCYKKDTVLNNVSFSEVSLAAEFG